jgi:hypothetical protein
MKKLVRVLLVFALLVVAALVGAVLLVDSLTRQAVERGGTYALGVETRLDEASIGLFSGAFALHGLTVANPPGFAEPSFFALRSGELVLPLSNLRQERIEIPKLELAGITLALERNAQGTNYAAILANLERLQQGGTEGGAGGTGDASGGGKVFRLGELLLRDIRATVQLVPSAGDLTRLELAIPEVRVQGLASDLTLPQLCALVVRTVVDAAVRQGADTLPREMLEDLRGKLGDLEDTARAKLEEKAGELLEGAGKLGPEAEAAAKQAKDALGGKLDDLLKKKKD